MISWFDWFFSFLGLFLFGVCVEFRYRPIGVRATADDLVEI